MGSVIDYIECPHCKNYGCFSDFYYKTGEEYIYCETCGYSKSITIINRDKLLTELTDEDWKIQENANPYASFRCRYKGGVAYNVGTINNKEELKDIAEQLNDKVEELLISRVVNDKIISFDLKRAIKLKKIVKNLSGK